MHQNSNYTLLGGSLQLNNGKVDKYLFSGGYCQNTDSTLAFNYFNQDHLGNNREVVDSNGKVVQINNYYPFGTPFYDEANTTNASLQPFKYNGKELDMMHGLNTYDYGARQYYPALPVWDRVDPLAEKYRETSPYVYCLNNPMLLLDSQGEEPTTYEAAIMAKHVYGDDVKLVGGWEKSKMQYKSFNSRNGLKSALYERTLDGVTEYAYVTAGTQDLTDIKEDALQILGNSKQYEESIQNALDLNKEYSKSELTFVGHSLGGGLAAANALKTDRNAITFNSAAISKSTKENLHLPQKTAKGLIFNVVVKGEIVNALQSKMGLKLEGSVYFLNAKYIPGRNIINTALRINNHLIDTVIKKLEKENGR